MKKLLRKSPIYPFLKFVRHQIRPPWILRRRFYEFTHDRTSTWFHTDTAYSHSWFYPRYANGITHEPQATQKFIEALSNATVVADVGSNLGWFTCIAGCHGKGSKIYSFELDNSNHKICARNIELNTLTNVTLENVAVVNYDGTLTYDKASIHEASAVHRIGRTGSLTCTVKAIRLDTYFSNKTPPEVLKIDVEGAEQLVLEGMAQILHGDSLRTILIEIHPKWLTKMGGSVGELCDILENAGFSLYSIAHRSDNHTQLPVSISEIESSAIGGRMFIAQKK